MGNNFQPGRAFAFLREKIFPLKSLTKETCKEILGKPTCRKRALLYIYINQDI